MSRLDFETDELLVLDDGSPAERTGSIGLSITAIYEDVWSETCEKELVHVSENSYTFSAPNPGCDFRIWGYSGSAKPDESQPEKFGLLFDVVLGEGGNGGGETGEEATFNTIEVAGEASQVLLWNGWTVGLYWDEPDGWCE